VRQRPLVSVASITGAGGGLIDISAGLDLDVNAGLIRRAPTPPPRPWPESPFMTGSRHRRHPMRHRSSSATTARWRRTAPSRPTPCPAPSSSSGSRWVSGRKPGRSTAC
jgi:hypothetical protein